MIETKYGDKYESVKDLDIVEIAKLVRKDLREQLPALRRSVRIERFAGGQAIDVTIYCSEEDSETAKAIATKILESYRRLSCDTLDYYHPSYFYHVRVRPRLALQKLGAEDEY